MILVYSKINSNRLTYIVEFVMNRILQSEFKITDKLEELKSFDGPIINYSDDDEVEGISIKPHGLLFEDRIQVCEVKIFDWLNEIAFFLTEKNNKIPFDIFSASFYLVSRYEEYFLKEKDRYNRFIGENSIAYKENFYQKPIIDIWAYKLKEIISENYPAFRFKSRNFKFIPSIDIDNAWAYKYKGFVRTAGGMVRSVITLKWFDLFRRINVLVFNRKDPYDNYSLIEKIHSKYGFEPIYFFLLRNNGKFDTSHDVTNKKFKKLIKGISKKYAIGIHPSYTSNSNASLIKAETSILSGITSKKITKSRNHFLKIKFPKTFNSLIKVGIKQDYSVGFSSLNGFRAGTCSSFKFFDLKKNKITNLEMIPFQVMDATLKFYLKVKPKDAKEEILKLLQEVKNVDGTFVSLWHNESFSNKGIWKSWLPVYESLLKECTKS